MDEIKNNSLGEVVGGAYQKINKGDTYYEFQCKRCHSMWTSKTDSSASDRNCPECREDSRVTAFEMRWE